MQSEKEMAESAAGRMLFAILVALAGCALMTGCTSSTGWGVGFNIYPVTQMRNVQSLQGNQSDVRTIKRAPAPKSGQTAEDDY